ncbi:MAG: hypothetical protein RBU21_00200 [FCB group bacterium]|jgi:hypothetical protein|nr:hypothetical protein [FCB group bacterium]
MKSRLRIVWCASAIAVVLGLAGCPRPEPSDADLAAAFTAAVADAQQPTAGKICRSLTPVAGYNDALVWEGEPGASRVLMTTWTSYPGYVVGKSYKARSYEKYQPSVDLWVTAVPEVKDFVRRHPLATCANLDLRLKQLLGMPHTTSRTWFVEFWVHPEDLFRPSADPEVSDREAELAFRPDTAAQTTSAEHVAWIENQVATNTWPWTRLGYTYDWGNPVNHVGLSEFIIRRNADITVVSITPTAEYAE